MYASSPLPPLPLLQENRASKGVNYLKALEAGQVTYAGHILPFIEPAAQRELPQLCQRSQQWHEALRWMVSKGEMQLLQGRSVPGKMLESCGTEHAVGDGHC